MQEQKPAQPSTSVDVTTSKKKYFNSSLKIVNTDYKIVEKIANAGLGSPTGFNWLYIIDTEDMVLVSDQNHCYLQIIINVDSISFFTTSHFVFQ